MVKRIPAEAKHVGSRDLEDSLLPPQCDIAQPNSRALLPLRSGVRFELGHCFDPPWTPVAGSERAATRRETQNPRDLVHITVELPITLELHVAIE